MRPEPLLHVIFPCPLRLGRGVSRDTPLHPRTPGPAALDPPDISWPGRVRSLRSSFLPIGRKSSPPGLREPPRRLRRLRGFPPRPATAIDAPAIPRPLQNTWQLFALRPASSGRKATDSSSRYISLNHKKATGHPFENNAFQGTDKTIFSGRDIPREPRRPWHGAKGDPAANAESEDGFRSPGADPSAERPKSREGTSPVHGPDKPKRVPRGAAPWCAGGPGGCAHTHPPWPSGAADKQLKEKTTPVAQPKYVPWLLSFLKAPVLMKSPKGHWTFPPKITSPARPPH